ncbi:hypothetical protein REPUB_Repub05bG0052900 [Reevesia pubescens]
MHVIYEAGEAWSLPCFIEQSKSRESSAISVCWLEFVCCKGVKIGDMVVHQKSMADNRMEAQFKIEVKRKLRLLGVDVWSHVL